MPQATNHKHLVDPETSTSFGLAPQSAAPDLGQAAKKAQARPMTAEDLADRPLGPQVVHQWQTQIADYVEDQSWERPKQVGLTRWPMSKTFWLIAGGSVGLWGMLLSAAWITI